MVKLFWNVLHYYHLWLCRANVAWCAVEKKKTKFSRTWKGKFFSSTWVLFTSYVLANNVLFVPVGKRSNSRSPKFCKLDALKNLAIFTGKHLGWRFFLINFIKKRHQHRCFSVNVTKCLSTAFYIEHIPFIILFTNFMSSGTKLMFFIFLVPLLCFS